MQPQSPNSSSTSLPQSPNSSTKPDRISWNMKEGSWRKQCAVAGIAACMIVSTDMVPLLGSDQSNSITLAENMQTHLIESRRRSVARWSDKRSCPPWISNQLEIVVPENLPRPSTHRRSESVKLSKLKESSSNQVIRLAIRNGNGCFTM